MSKSLQIKIHLEGISKQLLAGFFLTLMALTSSLTASQINDLPLGLYARDGAVMHQGRPYRAMGINYNDCFTLLLKDGDNRDFVEGFKILKEHKIPYIRFRAGPYSHMRWKLYAENPKEYFRRMDLLVREAEKQNLGLIPSLFWYAVAVPDFVDEPLSAIGDKDSKSRKFIRKYTTEMVTRYKDSPTIFGWEAGNEYMLYADLPGYDHLPEKKIGSDQPRTKADKLLRPMILDMYKDFHETVRKIDKDRIIATGDSIPRAHAWHNRHKGRWGLDSKEQWLEIFQAETPDCYEAASFHLYEETDGNYYTEKVPLEQIVSDITAVCRKNKKVIWAGELGMPGNSEKSKKLFFRMMKSIEDNEIELSAIWNFVPKGNFQSDWDILPQGDRAYMLQAVKELNERFAVGVNGCKTEARPGLTVIDGKLYKDGKPYKGIGINYFTALIRMTGLEGHPPNLADKSYRQGFETLRKHEIPFIRFSANGFYPNDWNLYFNNREEYFKAFDGFVADAEKLELGLIPCLFWYFPTVPDIVGESVDQWGNTKSKTHELMRRYTTEVVSRYKDSPAILGWEFGNEWIHVADLPDLENGRGWTEPDHAPKPPLGLAKTRTAKDKMYRKNVWVAYKAFAETVRSIDPHRPVFSGDTKPRPSSYHLWKEKSWTFDSKDEWETIFLKDNQPMDALSAHLYYYTKNDKQTDSGVLGLGPKEYIEFMMEISKRANKPLYVGEFGPANGDNTVEQEKQQFEAVLDMMVTTKVPLSALWNFDFQHVDQVRWNITENNHRAYMLDALQEANKKLK
jgi:endo-1,4-beta-mannosidase